MKKLLSLILVLAMIFTLAACGTTDGGSANSGSTDAGTTDEGTPEGDSGTTEDGGAGTAEATLLRGTCTTTPETLDPARGTGTNDEQVYVNIYEPLVKPNAEDGHPEACLAESWDVEEDGLTYTFHLNTNAKFASGNPVTANDVKYSMDRMLAIGEGYASIFAANVESTNVIDDQTVEFKMQKVFGPFVTALTLLRIVDSELVKSNQADGDFGEFGDYGLGFLQANSAGSGPYVITQFNVHDKMVMEKNANYWNGGVPAEAPDKVEITELVESATTKMLITSGDLEFVHGQQDAETYNAIMADENLDSTEFIEPGLNYFMINTKKAPTDDVHIRRAISYATDYEQVAELIGGAEVADGPVPSNVFGYSKDHEIFTFDLDKAKEEIAASQYADTLGDYEVSVDYIEGNGNTGKAAYLLAGQLEELGFKVVINEVPWVNFCNNEAEIETSPSITNLFASCLYPEAGSLLELKYASWTLGNWNQNEWLQDDKVDQMLNDAFETLDDDERVEKYAELQKYLVDEVVPSVYTCTSVYRPVFNKNKVEWCPAHCTLEYNFYYAGMKML